MYFLTTILKKFWRRLEFFLGVIVPSLSFMIMFISFCIQIFSRYILHKQFEWTYEFTVLGFMWTVVFGALYACKHKEHVSFSLIYDRLGPITRALFDIIGSIVILISFVLMYVPTIKYVGFIAIKETPVLKISFKIIYAPFIMFITFAAGYLIRDIIKAIKVVLTPKEVLKEMETIRKEVIFLSNEEKVKILRDKESELLSSYLQKREV